MRNRAKCKLCGDLIESFHRYDYITCNCGEISIDGGNDYFKCSAKDWGNFLRVDDLGVARPVKLEDDEKEEKAIKEEMESKPTKKQMIEMLVDMAKTIERLPDKAMSQPINQYDYYALLTLLAGIFKEA